MTQSWYYAAGTTRQGPLQADDLLRLYQGGRIRGETPVWHEGLPDWVPLASVAASVGLPPLPPPLPASASAMAVPPTRRGLHWIWIVVLVVAACAVPLIALLAAIALPAYNDYVVRSRIAEVALAAAPLRQHAEIQRARDGTCPIVPAPGAGVGAGASDGSIAALAGHRHVQALRAVETGPDRHCEITVQLRGVGHSAVDGHRLSWSFDPDARAWRCGGDLRRAHLPAACRY
ncbi:GYF domain-containing protein [Luteimonas deserti]|uniref:DUF4339 domain-containing protein n=1 Tax=Luteimonas deserti TaxID=2752306 RepID=A0A7Z0TYG3_9GAMM|nr:GYF domain-containing protein [Luteimonas deserti]NYZ62332.1 DUF4339 domain-containing protein [Luteimonas deserti]